MRYSGDLTSIRVTETLRLHKDCTTACPGDVGDDTE